PVWLRLYAEKPEDVLAEMRRLADAGYRELVFTGIEIASYGIDFRDGRQGFRLIDLLERADGQGEGIRIRLGSLEPAYLKPEVIARLAALAHLAPHFHLSLQSASDEVLRRMRRKYRTNQVRDILVRIREAVPGAQFTADLMTGFPGETEEMFSETLSFVREARFLHVHVFPYSRRKDTEADAMDGQLSAGEKNDRARRLIAAAASAEAEVYREEARLLPVREILTEERTPEGEVIGHTGSFLEVRVSDPEGRLPLHSFCQVRITGAGPAFLSAVPDGTPQSENCLSL
ncbi:MAG: radical SAM protein, partial [Candidatus Methanomethylophilaceae archaeon]|nr:radical SAM protein [Candidatus Methanomethylophilaceae archaeon]